MAIDKVEMLRARVAKLGPEQREKLRAQVEAAGISWDRVAPAEMVKASRPDRLPLSPAQMQFWLMHQVNPDSAASAIAFSWEMTGPLNRESLSRALAYLVDRHAPLRACFPSDGGTPWQSPCDAPFALEHSTIAPGAYSEAERAFVAQPFDMANGPLFRAHLVQLGPEHHQLMLSLHHIIADGWSRGILVRELAVAYRAFSAGGTPALPDLTRDFADLVLSQQHWLQGDEAKAQSQFWKQRLADLPEQSLPVKSDAQLTKPDSQTLLLDLDTDLAARVRHGAARLGATPFMLLLAIFKLLLHRYTDQTDLAVGTPTAGRRDPDAAGVIGLFVNTLVLRSELDPQVTFGDWLTTVRQGFAQSFDHQDLPFATVVDAVGAKRRAGQTPLFQTLFQVQTDGYRQQNAAQLDLGDPALKVRQNMIPLPEAKFDLSWHLMERETGLSLIAEYRSGLFDDAFIRRMAVHFQTLTAAALDQPDCPVVNLDYLAASERASSVQNGPAMDIGPAVPDGIAATAAQTPDAEALVLEQTTLTYAELDARATELASRLRAHPAISDGSRVVVALERGVELVVALLAALRAGVAYVPLDPAQPDERKAHILQDAQADLVISDTPIAGVECPQLSVTDLCALPPATLAPVSPDALAYVIYTSGSTGRPKGVPITHRALANLIGSMIREPGLTPADRLLAITTVSFDIAGLELFAPLCAGATLVLADRETVLSPPDLIRLMDQQHITHMQATPALWRALVESGWQGKPDLTLLCGGEALDTVLARELLNRSAALWNMYGPTETTIWSAALQVDETHLAGTTVPVGGAIANTDLHVLDTHGHPLPTGIPGELAISGAGLSPGYWNLPDLTAEKFAGGLYRTGDLVVLELGGTLRFLGRTDHQVKLNGFRIEPGEIEAALVELGLVEALVVLDPKQPRLIAYCRTGAEISSAAALKQQLAQRLPAYMVPSAFVFLDRFALNANGKVDRSRLPAPEADIRIESRPPETEAERILHAIWCAVLARGDIGVDDNFFDLGGASVTAMQIVARARDKGLVLQPAQLFEHQTISAQARIASVLPQTQLLPFSPWQAFIRGQKLAPWLVTLSVPPGAAAHLAAALKALTGDHVALRFGVDDGWKTDHHIAEATAPHVDLGAWARAEVTEAHPWRACITPDNRLVISAHPLLLDATSVEHIAHALREKLDDLIAGQPDTPQPGGDFGAWLKGARVNAAPAPIALLGAPATHAELSTPIHQGVSGSELIGLRSSAQVLNSNPEGLTLTALVQTLGQWGNFQNVGVDVLTSTHLHVGQSRVLGNFTRLLPLSVARPQGDATTRVTQVAQAMRAANPLGISPRDGGGLGVLLSWRSAIAEDIEWLSRPTRPLLPGYAIALEAEMTAQKLSLHWRFDRNHLSRATVENLAKRHLTTLIAMKPGTAPSTGTAAKKKTGSGNRLDQLKAQIRRPKG